MTEGDVVLTSLPQADGQTKVRPVLALRRMPPHGDMLVCGISSQLHQQVEGFDDVLHEPQADFTSSGLKAASLIRLGFLAVLPVGRLLGAIGSIDTDRHRRLLSRLADHLNAGATRA